MKQNNIIRKIENKKIFSVKNILEEKFFSSILNRVAM
jgi:hypothetical protein